MTDWISVTEALPEVEQGMQSVSVNVRGQLEDGSSIRCCYYDHRTGLWRDYDDESKVIFPPVIAWRRRN